jgi:hypothetical protein
VITTAADAHYARQVARERLTLDSTVVIDLLQDDRPRHAFAVRLVDLARLGEVELAVTEYLEQRG